MSADLIVFLRARLDEDYEAARRVLGVNVMAKVRRGQETPRWVPSPEGDGGIWDSDGTPRVRYVWAAERDHIIRHDPARVLAEVEGKRRIVKRYEDAAYTLGTTRPGATPHDLMTGATNSLHAVLHALALPYADHPDYQQEWAA